MASTDHKGGRAKTRQHVMALLRHNDKELREITKEHSNKHIKKHLTCENHAILGRNYEEAVQYYDETLAEIIEAREYKTPNAKNAYLSRLNNPSKNGIVSCTTLETTLPEELANAPKEIQLEWFADYTKVVQEFYPEFKLIEGYVHYDEIHKYRHKDTAEMTDSLPHIHLVGLPVVDGQLNNKEFSSRKNMKALNYAVHVMTKVDYGCDHLKYQQPSQETVEMLKKKSRIVEKIYDDMEESKQNQLENEALSVDILEAIEKKQAELEQAEEDYKAKEEALQKLQEKLEKDREMLEKEESRLLKRENQLNQKEKELQALQDRLDTQKSDQAEQEKIITVIEEELAKREENVKRAEENVTKREEAIKEKEISVTKAITRNYAAADKVEQILAELKSLSEQEKEAYRLAVIHADEIEEAPPTVVIPQDEPRKQPSFLANATITDDTAKIYDKNGLRLPTDDRTNEKH